ncbi:MAG TPA: bifunctional phosphoglucose/phosphomannose isomerase [Candidatus Saccharimonadales bacterium]|nr:bifunctional phosphoglucose/phosphomannose isomerase [Candidatus Saccharimonadales bacterium]
MLDDLKYIHEKDAGDALGIAERQAGQLLHDFKLQAKQFGNVDSVVYAGMGGSGLAGQLLASWPPLGVPFELVRNYDIPDYVGSNTLFIASSYSGNTEETLSALAQAEAKGAQIAVIASGGKLKQIAEEKGYLFALIPKAEQPRYAALYNLKALLDILHMAGVVKEDTRPELERASKHLQSAVQSWRAEVPTRNNPAKQFAQELLGKSVVIYAGPKLFPAAYKWKISVNENAKQVAWVGQLPEFNHNEFIGWSQQPVDKPYAVVDLRSRLEHPRIQKRFEVSERLLSGMRPAPLVAQAQGDTLPEQLLWTVAYGDFVTLYLGILNGLNPAPIDLVEKFKAALNA